MAKTLTPDEALALRLKALRIKLKKTRIEMALALDITERTFFDWEAGRLPKKPILDAWCALLGTTA